MLVQGDARSIPLADGSVQCAVTSPPYWGLRDYGVADQIGLEPSLGEYLAVMVGVFREVRRVLRDDGTCWVNMGDGYTSGGRTTRDPGQSKLHPAFVGDNYREGLRPSTPTGLKPKDLLMQPHRLAIALQDDGWYVRSDIVWHKPNPMPESVTDRPTKSHEYIFLLSKSQRYYFDAEAVREPASEPRRCGKNSRANVDRVPRESLKQNAIGLRRYVGFNERYDFENPPAGRNLRSVWTMTTRACKEAHFATFPIDLPLRCIKAGTSERGRCPHCGAPWRRVVERVAMVINRSDRTHELGRTRSSGTMVSPASSKTITWLPTCKCPAHEPVPCVVLDPFGGACTTALAAKELGRHCVIVERKMDYLNIGRDRLANHRPRGAKARKVREVKPEETLWA